MAKNRLTELLGIKHPIVLAPFGGVSSVELTAGVSDLGGLGSYGLYGYEPARVRETIAALKQSTERPFAVNLWLPTGDEVRPDQVDLGPIGVSLTPLFEEVGLPVPQAPARFLPDFTAQIEAVLAARPPVLSFVYGVPPTEVMNAAHERGIQVIGTATTVEEAMALAAAGIDAIVATGAEAGGHRTSFLKPAEESLVGGLSLIPQIVDAVHVPVIAAGGIAERRGVAAAFALGAAGVQVGTAFLRCKQSAAPQAHREAIAGTTASETVLTKALSGRLARGIPNRAMGEIEAAGAIAPFPAQNWITGRFRREAALQEKGELLSLWAGQSAALASRTDVNEVFDELAAGLPR